MRIITTILLAIILLFVTGCEFRYDVPEYTGSHPMSVYIQSDSVFSVSGNLYLATMQDLPVTIYNPNNYAITVTADGTDYTIAPLETLDLKEKVSKDSCSELEEEGEMV